MRRWVTPLLVLVFSCRYASFANEESIPRPPSPRPDFVLDASRLYGVHPALVRAVIEVESGYDPWAVSPKGASGLMQLMPETARMLGVANPFDPRQNVMGGVRYLRALDESFRGNTTLALAAYNAGPGAIARYRGVPPYRETRDYLWKIRTLLERVRREEANAPRSSKKD